MHLAGTDAAAAAQTNLNNVQGSQGLQLTNLAEVKDLCTGMVEAGEALPTEMPGMHAQRSGHGMHADCVTVCRYVSLHQLARVPQVAACRLQRDCTGLCTSDSSGCLL